MAFHDAVAYIVILVVIIVVSGAIVNTMLMSVLQRRRELGVMMAVGTPRSFLVKAVLTEALLVALTGYAAGGALGYLTVAGLEHQGLDFSAYIGAMDTMPGLTGIVYPETRALHWQVIGLMVLLVALISAWLPLRRIVRLSPLDAIHPRRVASAHRYLNISVRADRPMGMWLQIALRSLLRNPRRSVITALATAFGFAAYIFLYALTDGFFYQMVNNSTSLISGHAQIARAADDDRLVLWQPDAALIGRLDHDRDVEAYSPRISSRAIVATARQSLPVELTGVDPGAEVQVTRLWSRITSGQYLQPDQPGLLIGKKLAESLDVQAGSKLVITLQGQDGDLISAAWPVTGIFSTGSELLDEQQVFAPLSAVRKLIGADDKSVSALAIRLQDSDRASDWANQMNTTWQTPSLQARPWQQLLPVVVQMIDMTRIDFYIILSVVFLVVGFGVMNTMIMSVAERVRELGVMRALGTPARALVGMIVLEAAILAAAGMAVGALAGGGLVVVFSDSGIDLTGISGALETIPGMTDRLIPVLIPEHLFLPGMLLFLIASGSAMLPAWQAAKLNPVEAIRHG